MVRTSAIAAAACAALILALTVTGPLQPATLNAATPVETGRFVWHDLMTRDMAAAKRFYGELLGWRFVETTRGDRPYVIARNGKTLVAGFVDVSAMPAAAPQWIGYMAVDDVDQSLTKVRAAGGKVLIDARNFNNARAAVIADPQGAPLGLAQARIALPEIDPTPRHLFWDEYLAKDAAKALDFYKQIAGYQSAVSDTKLGVEYHVLRNSRPRAGLFQLPATATSIEANWLPYVLVDDPAAVAARVTGLGGNVLLPAAPERRNNTLVVIADPGGAPLALQKFPF